MYVCNVCTTHANQGVKIYEDTLNRSAPALKPKQHFS